MLDPSFWAGKRVLLTGHTGFKGSWLSLWLLNLGVELCGYALKPDFKRSLFVDLDISNRFFHNHFGDIRDFQELKSFVQLTRPEVVLHLAAQPIVRHSYRDPLGTWATNVQGSLHLLESLKCIQHHCSVVMVTTDKVYANREWDYGYRENDRLGGHDPYSASKAATELAVSCWRDSFCGYEPHQTSFISVASARAGNVIGGGDWAEDRIVPDSMRALAAGEPISVRSPSSTRPWQHVLEPLGGYLLLAERLSSVGTSTKNPYACPFNFGPNLESNRAVSDLVQATLRYWPGHWQDLSDPSAPHEASRLHLQIDKAHHQLNWAPRWDFNTTVARTVNWYRSVNDRVSPLDCCLADLDAYQGELTVAS